MTGLNKFEPKEDSGQLFKVAPEDRKSDKHAEYDGEFKIRCPHCQQASVGWIRGWIREAKNGSKYFAFSFRHRTSRGGA